MFKMLMLFLGDGKTDHFFYLVYLYFFNFL